MLAATTGQLSNFVLATIGILTAGSQFSPYFDKLKERALKRQFWFLTDAKDVADGLILSYPRIKKLWNIGSFDLDRQSLDNFARQFARLKTLTY